jgi:ferrochelatase
MHRYQTIGGVSPLHRITQAQAKGLQTTLDTLYPGTYRVYLGLKHAEPFIVESASRMVQDGIHRAVSLVLAPHYSAMSVGDYQRAANTIKGCEWLHVNNWHLQPQYLHALEQRIQQTLKKFIHPQSVTVLFTAHSLPKKIRFTGDPYEQQLQETNAALASRLHLEGVHFAWQSAGRTQDEWLGPDILSFLRELHQKKKDQVVICPVGFVTDHLEILYDLDVEAQNLADSLGMTLHRTPSLNDDPEFLLGLARVVEQRSQMSREKLVRE